MKALFDYLGRFFKPIFNKMKKMWFISINWLDYWINLLKEIIKRIFEPLRYPTYNIYFFTIIVFVGGLGFWIPYFQADTPKLVLAQQLATYLLAIASAAFADICFTFFSNLKMKKDSEEEKVELEMDKANSTMMSLWSFSFMITVIAVTLGVYSLVNTNPDVKSVEATYNYSIIGTILALFLWLISNYDNRKLKESFFFKPYNPLTTVDPTEEPAGEGVQNNGTVDLE